MPGVIAQDCTISVFLVNIWVVRRINLNLSFWSFRKDKFSVAKLSDHVQVCSCFQTLEGALTLNKDGIKNPKWAGFFLTFSECKFKCIPFNCIFV